MSDKANPKRGRPVERKPPEPIPDTAENAIKSLLKTRPKPERDTLRKRADQAAS